MAQTIRIKRSTGSSAPGSLANAELAYSEGGDGTLYIGVGTGGAGGSASAVVQVGGAAVASAITTSRAAGYVFAGPANGANAAPTWRGLVATDIPDISSTYLTVSTAGSTYAPINSPTFTGTPASVTPANNSNSTAIATTAFVQAVVAAATPTGVAYLAQNNTFAANQTQTVAGTLDVTGTLKLNGSTVTASSSELNLVANATANTVVNGKAVIYGSSGEVAATSISTTGNVTVGGNLVVQGSTTTIESSTLSVSDKAIELAKVASPTDTTADGAGIVIKGASDKTLLWVDATDAFTSSEHLDLAAGKSLYINGTQVLSSSALGSGVTSSSLTAVATISNGTWQGSTVGVAYGGTGATTLTGLVKGNGTSPFTAAVAGTDYLSPSSDIDGGSY